MSDDDLRSALRGVPEGFKSALRAAKMVQMAEYWDRPLADPLEALKTADSWCRCDDDSPAPYQGQVRVCSACDRPR